MLRIALVTRAIAPYHKALQEAFADALSDDGSLCIFYPEAAWCPFDQSKTLPAAPNIRAKWIASAAVANRATNWLARYRSEAIGTQLPSRALWRALDEFQPDLLWAHELSPYTLAGVLFAKSRATPVIVSSDVGMANQRVFPWPVRLWHRVWSHLADGIIACTPAARQPLCGMPIPFVEAFHAADSRIFVPRTTGRASKNGTTTFVCAGRILPIKGIDLLLAAAARLKQISPAHWRLKLIGADTDGYGESLINRLGLSDEVSMTGFKEGEALRNEFGNGDVFVMASRRDTYAAVVHEAACLGLPLLVSRRAGAAEALVQEGVNGFIVDPEDTETFAERLVAMCDRPMRERMADESRKIGEQFSAHRRGRAVREWMKAEFGV